MSSTCFGNQIRLRVAARAIGVEHDLLRKWRQRFGLFGTPGQPKRELSVPEVCALRVAVIALHKCRGITVREALDVSARLATPAVEALLTGERAVETIELGNDKTGNRVVISLGTVVADVLPRLGLGFVSRGFGRTEHVTPNQIGVLQ
jgi:transposase-like protein